MKLGIFLLVFGLVLAAAVVVALVFGQDLQSTFLGFPRYGQEAYTQCVEAEAVGLGLTVLGSGLAIGGIVRMIVKR
jgi:hypothetical protein